MCLTDSIESFSIPELIHQYFLFPMFLILKEFWNCNMILKHKGDTNYFLKSFFYYRVLLLCKVRHRNNEDITRIKNVEKLGGKKVENLKLEYKNVGD